jgi:hypothetical protein
MFLAQNMMARLRRTPTGRPARTRLGVVALEAREVPASIVAATPVDVTAVVPLARYGGLVPGAAADYSGAHGTATLAGADTPTTADDVLTFIPAAGYTGRVNFRITEPGPGGKPKTFHTVHLQVGTRAAIPTTVAFTTTGWTYDGTAHPVDLTSVTVTTTGGQDVTAEGDIAVRYYSANDPSTALPGAPAAAGVYVAEVSFTSTNPQYADSKAVTGFTVGKAALTVTADGATREYGAADPALTATLTGAAAGDGITASYSTTATALSPVGTYPVTATLNDPNGKLANYTVTSVPGTLTVAPKALGDGAVTAGTRSVLNVAGTDVISFAVTVDPNALVGADTVSDLFDGATFAVTVFNGNKTELAYTLTADAQVVAGTNTVIVSLRMTAGLQAALLDVLANGSGTTGEVAQTNAVAATFALAATSAGGNYTLSCDAVSRLYWQGKLAN